MSEALVPAVTRPPVARTATAAMALPAVIVDAGPVAVERFLEFFAASIANGRMRAAYGRAVGQFLSWCAARGLGLHAIAPLHVAGVHPHASGVGPDGQTSPGRHPGAVRLARRPPGAAGESGRGGAGTEARGDQGGDAGVDAGRDAVAARWDRHGDAGRATGPWAAERDGVQLRAGERGRGDAASGLFPAGDAGVAAAAREGRQASRRAGPSPCRGRRRSVSGRRRGRRREGAVVSERGPVGPPEQPGR